MSKKLWKMGSWVFGIIGVAGLLVAMYYVFFLHRNFTETWFPLIGATSLVLFSICELYSM